MQLCHEYDVLYLFTQVDKATSDLRNNNRRLKKTLDEVSYMINCIVFIFLGKLHISYEQQSFVSFSGEV